MMSKSESEPIRIPTKGAVLFFIERMSWLKRWSRLFSGYSFMKLPSFMYFREIEFKQLLLVEEASNAN
ncbi:MAG: hypothetical protein WCH05_02025 [Chlorobiaceae bacterium]